MAGMAKEAEMLLFSKCRALATTAVIVVVAITLDRFAEMPTVALVISLLWMIILADAWDGDRQAGTGATGYSLLDELDPSDADYVADVTGMARSIFEVASLPGNVAEVKGFRPVIHAKRHDAE